MSTRTDLRPIVAAISERLRASGASPTQSLTLTLTLIQQALISAYVLDQVSFEIAERIAVLDEIIANGLRLNDVLRRSARIATWLMITMAASVLATFLAIAAVAHLIGGV